MAFIKKFFAVLLIGVLSVSALYLGITAFLRTVYPINYSEYIESASKKYDIDKTLIYAVIKTESGFQEKSVSNVGARGLMQLMPDTFEWLKNGVSEYNPIDAELNDILDPKINIDYGCCYLKYLLDKYECESTAIAAYNAGPGAVDNWLSNTKYTSDGITLDVIPYYETENYVRKVLSAKDTYYKLYFGDSIIIQ